MTQKEHESDNSAESGQDLVRGCVERTTGSFYRVLMADGSRVECVLRGKIRLDGLNSTNPIAVGDWVHVRMEEGSAVIQHIEPRVNYIVRRATKSTAQRQILCANIDQALIVHTLEKPHTPMGFLDSFLVTAGAYHIPAVIVLNKIDVLRERKLHLIEEFVGLYRSLGYRVETMSALDSSKSELARALLEGKRTFITGRSGAGKSTFVNLADPNLKLKTAAVSESNRYGRHTTTFAEMFPLTGGGWVVDAPGVREFHLTDIDLAEVSHYFPEMLGRLHECRFNNCLHVNEPGCAVLEELENGGIAESRYSSYLFMLEELKAQQPY